MMKGRLFVLRAFSFDNCVCKPSDDDGELMQHSYLLLACLLQPSQTWFSPSTVGQIEQIDQISPHCAHN